MEIVVNGMFWKYFRQHEPLCDDLNSFQPPQFLQMCHTTFKDIF